MGTGPTNKSQKGLRRCLLMLGSSADHLFSLFFCKFVARRTRITAREARSEGCAGDWRHGRTVFDIGDWVRLPFYSSADNILETRSFRYSKYLLLLLPDRPRLLIWVFTASVFLFVLWHVVRQSRNDRARGREILRFAGGLVCGC